MDDTMLYNNSRLSRCKIYVCELDRVDIIYNGTYGIPELVRGDICRLLSTNKLDYSLHNLMWLICNSYGSYSTDHLEYNKYGYWYQYKDVDEYAYYINIKSSHFCNVVGFKITTESMEQLFNIEVGHSYENPEINNELLYTICEIYRNLILKDDNIRNYSEIIDSIRKTLGSKEFLSANYDYIINDLPKLSNGILKRICELYTELAIFSDSNRQDNFIETTNYIRSHWWDNYIDNYDYGNWNG